MSAIAGSALFQDSVFVGLNLEDILYGVELVLYFTTLHYLLNHRGQRTGSDVFYAIFSTVLLLVATIWVITQAVNARQMWLSQASFPSGADAVWMANISAWYMDLATISLTILQLMTDALMIYRCWMVWNSYRVIIAPSILWMTNLVLGIMVIWITSTSGGGVFFHGIAAQVGLAFYSSTVFLTAMLTCMICYRVLRYGRLIKERLAYEDASLYFTIAALVVESVLPYTLVGIAFAVSLGLGSQVMGAFAYLWALMMCVSPQMLILRVAMRRARANKTLKQQHTTINFSPQETMPIALSSFLGTDTDIEVDKENAV